MDVSYKSILARSLAIAAFLMMLAASPGWAQIRFGLVGGANFSSLKDLRADNGLVSFDSKSSFHAGVFMDLDFGPINFRPTAMYLKAGPLFEGAPFLVNNTFDMVYIAVPLDVVYNIDLGLFKPYVFAGPELRLLNSTDAPVDLKENFKDYVMNASAGLGVEIKFPGSRVTLMPHIRYSFGLSDIINDSFMVGDVNVQTDTDSKLDTWLLSMGLIF